MSFCSHFHKRITSRDLKALTRRETCTVFSKPIKGESKVNSKKLWMHPLLFQRTKSAMCYIIFKRKRENSNQLKDLCITKWKHSILFTQRALSGCISLGAKLHLIGVIKTNQRLSSFRCLTKTPDSS